MDKNCILSLFVVVASFSCQKKEIAATTNFDCVNAQFDNAPTLGEASSRIVGQWQLKKMAAMRIQTEVPNIRLVFSSNKTVEVYQNEQLIQQDKYQLIENQQGTTRFIALETTKTTFQNGDYSFLRGTVRVCDAELLIDNGMAFDAPGYFFVKQ